LSPVSIIAVFSGTPDALSFSQPYETNPRSLLGYLQGLTRLSKRPSWQDGGFALDRAASRLLTTLRLWLWQHDSK
jgi:hypothetical protein